MKGRRLAAIGIAAVVGVALFAWPKASAPANAATPMKAVHIVALGGTCSNEYCFQPSQLTIFQAQSVTWTNTTGVIHTVTTCTTAVCSGVGPGTGTDPAFDSGFIAAGSNFSHQFHGVGTYDYYCRVHGYTVMHGTITVKAFSVKTTSLPGGTVGTTYSATLKANGGQPTLTWTVASGALPAGLRLSSAGKISGTPTRSGTFALTVKVTDHSSSPLTAEQALSITIT
jgi:plastocyanin